MIHMRYINSNMKLEDNHRGMETKLVNYYKNLLLEPIPDRSPTINKVTRHIPTLITQEKNEVLMRSITIEEVDHSIKEMPVGNAPGLDGFTTDFFHHC